MSHTNNETRNTQHGVTGQNSKQIHLLSSQGRFTILEVLESARVQSSC